MRELQRGAGRQREGVSLRNGAAALTGLLALMLAGSGCPRPAQNPPTAPASGTRNDRSNGTTAITGTEARVTRLLPNPCQPGKEFQVTGTSLGTEPGEVRINKRQAKIRSWADRKIVAVMFADIPSFTDVVVEVGLKGGKIPVNATQTLRVIAKSGGILNSTELGNGVVTYNGELAAQAKQAFETAVRSGDYKAALAKAETILTEDRNNPMAYSVQGYALCQTGDMENAREPLETALLLYNHFGEIMSPDSYVAHAGLGLLLYRTKDYTNAVRYLQKAIRRNPGFGAAHLNLAQAYLQTHLKAEALKECDLLASHPDLQKEAAALRQQIQRTP